MIKFFIFVAFITSAPVIAAAPPGWDAFKQGSFYEARDAGRADASAEGLALACRAGLVLGGFMETNKAAVQSLHGAINDCNKALGISPSHYFAKMSLSIALSFEGKRLKRPSYPARAKAYILELIEAEPNNPLGYGALAAWHSEVSAAGFLARIALGARRNKAAKNFERAQKLGAIDYALRFEHIKFLARGNKADRKLAFAQARELSESDTNMAFDLLMQKQCLRLLEALSRDNKREIKTIVKDVAAFQNVIGEREVARFPLGVLVPLKSEKTRSQVLGSS